MKTAKLFSTSILATMALVVGVNTATAQDAAPAPQPVAEGRMEHRPGQGPHIIGAFMKEADSNADGALTQDEVNTWVGGLVSQADTSGDASISLSEFSNLYSDMKSEHLEGAFQNLDADDNGAITNSELNDRFANVVAELDRNNDGQLDRDDRPQRGGPQGGEQGRKRG